MKVKRKPDRFICLQESTSQIVRSDWIEITKGSHFLYEKELSLINTLIEAFIEMAFLIDRYKEAGLDLIRNPPSDLKYHLEQINQQKPKDHTNFIIEYHAIDLSTYFKSFLVLVKAVLDKLVPLYSYKFFDNLRQFDDKGARLVKSIKTNKHVLRKKEFLALVQEVKSDWLDSLIKLRDEYTHYSQLREYKNFWIPGDWVGKKNFADLSEFHQPTIEIAGKEIDALEYMILIKSKLVVFLGKFISLCDFTSDRRPKRYLKCECGHEFVKKIGSKAKEKKFQILHEVTIEIKDREKRYGVLICPECGEKTDTDLDCWSTDLLEKNS